MSKLLLTSPILGRDVGATVDVTAAEARFYASEGYGICTSSETIQRKATDTGVVGYKADDDPRLAMNRETPNGEVPGVDTKTVSEEMEYGTATGASQDRTGAASGTQDGAQPIANVETAGTK